jgi:hypothetical protein
MTGLPLKAEVWPRKRHMRRSKTRCLFDHLIGAQQEVLGQLEAEHLRGGEIEDQVKLGRLLDRQVAGLCAAQDLIDIVGGASEARQQGSDRKNGTRGSARVCLSVGLNRFIIPLRLRSSVKPENFMEFEDAR